MKKQNENLKAKDHKEIIENLSASQIAAVVSRSNTAADSMARLAGLMTAGVYDHKTVLPVLKSKIHEYLRFLQERVISVSDDDARKRELKAATAELAHFQKAINRKLVQMAKARQLGSDETLHFSFSKLANDRRELLGQKAVYLKVKETPQAETENKPSQEKVGQPEGSCSVAQEIKDEAHEKALSVGRQLTAVSDLIETLKQQGDVHAMSNIATQCISAIEELQKEKPVKQAASNKRAFTTALKLMQSYRSNVNH